MVSLYTHLDDIDEAVDILDRAVENADKKKV